MASKVLRARCEEGEAAALAEASWKISHNLGQCARAILLVLESSHINACAHMVSCCRAPTYGSLTIARASSWLMPGHSPRMIETADKITRGLLVERTVNVSEKKGSELYLSRRYFP